MDTLTSKPLLTTTLTVLTTALLIRALCPPRPPFPSSSTTLPSPRTTLLPTLTPSQALTLPYPPDSTALPGAHSIPTPHNTTTHVFTLGPPTARHRILLLPGISTPCIALANLALALAHRHGCRVCLLDYYGRGWTDAPDPAFADHDTALYMGQILCVLASEGWLGGEEEGQGGGVHVLGYSFGGGLAVALAGLLPARVASVTLVAPGGLVPRGANSWRTRLLYSRGWLPEAVLEWFVRRRFAPAADEAAVGSGDGVFENALVSPTTLPGVTVGRVMAWQLEHHVGFIPAVMSAFRYGPIHERYEEWGRLGGLLAERRADRGLPGLLGGRVLLVLGGSDSIVREASLVPEVRRILGDEGVEVVVLDAGHEVAITKGAEIADACVQFWEANDHVPGEK